MALDKAVEVIHLHTPLTYRHQGSQGSHVLHPSGVLPEDVVQSHPVPLLAVGS